MRNLVGLAEELPMLSCESCYCLKFSKHPCSSPAALGSQSTLELPTRRQVIIPLIFGRWHHTELSALNDSYFDSLPLLLVPFSQYELHIITPESAILRNSMQSRQCKTGGGRCH